jgi:hypothetical protein
MAIVQSKGIPDVFLTFTCNPNWEEIVVELWAQLNSLWPSKFGHPCISDEGESLS